MRISTASWNVSLLDVLDLHQVELVKVQILVGITRLQMRLGEDENVEIPDAEARSIRVNWPDR